MNKEELDNLLLGKKPAKKKPPVEKNIRKKAWIKLILGLIIFILFLAFSVIKFANGMDSILEWILAFHTLILLFILIKTVRSYKKNGK